ncbi:hypothetical protein ACE6H2_026386 [Prunus campanulata]
MAPSTPSLQGERGSEEKLSLLLLVPMPCIVVDDVCYVSALLPMPVLVCFRFLCYALPTAVLTGCLCSALSAALLTGFLCSAMCPIF